MEAAGTSEVAEARAMIDELDDAILGLLCARAGRVRHLLKLKKRYQMTSRDDEREREVLTRIADRNRSAYTRATIQRVWSALLMGARGLPEWS